MNRTKKISRHKCFHSFHLYKIFNCFELIIFHGAKKKLQNVVFVMAPFHYCSDARERETDEYFGCENSRMCLICFSLHFSLAVCIRVDFGAMKKHSLALNTVCGWYRLCICCVPILLKTLDAFHSVSHLTQYLFSSGSSSSNEGPKKSAIHQK